MYYIVFQPLFGLVFSQRIDSTVLDPKRKPPSETFPATCNADERRAVSGRWVPALGTGNRSTLGGGVGYREPMALGSGVGRRWVPGTDRHVSVPGSLRLRSGFRFALAPMPRAFLRFPALWFPVPHFGSRYQYPSSFPGSRYPMPQCAQFASGLRGHVLIRRAHQGTRFIRDTRAA